MTQEDLACIIKSVHSKLRRSCINGYERAGYKSLEKDKSRETRIVWTERFITSYFCANGDLQKLINKDKRSLDFHSSELVESLSDEQSECSRCCGLVFNSSVDLDQHKSDVRLKLSERLKTPFEPLVKEIRVLDVGSCYAPFLKFEHFNCLSIDLCPACEDVRQCDFLNVSAHHTESHGSSVQAALLSEDKRSVTSLPLGWFHGIVFSLLLEYLPSPKQRWTCCVKAHQLLQVNSVLVIITPDSNRQHRRAQQMKDWKMAIETIGFKRCVYQKLDHIHCMAFRKTQHREDYSKVTDMSTHLYIPQDFNTQSDSQPIKLGNETRESLKRSSCTDSNCRLSLERSSSDYIRSNTQELADTAEACLLFLLIKRENHSDYL
ncbi:C7orf60 [Bugula neritina]|uniref:S-adenosylmethionine sensor upstream of mTORC1 n=1 Tax=Bugula neritina TaxID=10212 RepID=A0A7J7IXD6_BUGNE|nr:C7orf60 [Bugula neritina]